MKRTPIYCALVEVQPLCDCELDPSEVAGAWVRCYIPATHTRSAVEMLENELREMKMRLLKTEWCVDYDNTEWENPGSRTENDHVEEARRTGEVVFDAFHTWGHDAPDVA